MLSIKEKLRILYAICALEANKPMHLRSQAIAHAASLTADVLIQKSKGSKHAKQRHSL